MPLRALVFLLASLSFACLLGTFYGFWTMQAFGCLILPPATALLAWIAWRDFRASPGAQHSSRTWIVEGAIAGLIAAFAYDLYRLPFVLQGAPLFRVFPRFGELLLGNTEPRWLVHALGWTYHFSNGAALGVMLLAMLPRLTPRMLLGGAIAWAAGVEVLLLLTPYPRFFGLPLDARFIFLTASAHAVFGITLGLWLRWRLGRLQVA
ncbi:MAG: hypothetical protein JWQ44_238 [Chthoniobacter sp.]|nr:hypothetical protein [Chthoniobacter sp.]